MKEKELKLWLNIRIGLLAEELDKEKEKPVKTGIIIDDIRARAHELYMLIDHINKNCLKNNDEEFEELLLKSVLLYNDTTNI